MKLIDDTIFRLNIYRSKCSSCKHFNWENCTCKAYPEYIPDDYVEGNKVHDSVQRGQEGDFVYEPETQS